MLLTTFDFNDTCLSSASRQQLNNIWKALKPNSRAVQSRFKLLRLIERNAFDPARGLYLPLGKDVWLDGKLPIHSQRLVPTDLPTEPFPFPYFCNALCIPDSWGTLSFDQSMVAAPKHRATNTGSLIVTIEHDCQTTAQLEELLSWTRGGNGEFRHSPFAKVDRELSRFTDYRGYSIVFSGNKSLHFHFLFSTKHLVNAPWDCSASDRLTSPQAAIINEAHRIYWDKAADTVRSVLQPSLEPDRSLRTLCHWRRSPWAVRELDEVSTVLALPRGTIVPQLVIHEYVRTRSGRGCEGFLVPADLQASPSRTRQRDSQTPLTTEGNQELLVKLEQLCTIEWGEFPKPVSVCMERGQWVIHFRNHANDRNPSTIVMADFTKLDLRGQHSFKRAFYLPDDMTADELCESLIADPEAASDIQVTGSAIPPLVARKKGWVESELERIESDFAERVDGAHVDQVATYRKRCAKAVRDVWHFDSNLLVVSPEGLGKTRSLFNAIAEESFDAATSVECHERRFNCFAFRSNEQAGGKAEEYRRSGKYRDAVQLMSVWEHYRRCCTEFDLPVIPQHQFRDHSLNGMLGHIKANQSSVFDAMEDARQRLWQCEGPSLFDPAMTVLFTSHALATRWHRSQVTPVWHHPDFRPFTDQNYDDLKRDLSLSQIVFDEPENELLLLVISEPMKVWIESFKRRVPSWREKSWQQRFDLYQSQAHEAPKRRGSTPEFEFINELMRVDLDELQAIDVDYEAIPFGCDQRNKGIYSPQHGKRFFLAPQQWMTDCKSRLTFLTTESLVSRVLLGVHEKQYKTIQVLQLHPESDLFPIDVPVVLDRRAAKGEQKITSLARELLANPNAIVIGNKTKLTDPRVMTFQAAKGRNGLEQNDIRVIPTFLSPDQYAELAIIGGWLNLPEVVTAFYEDQISQSVGRSKGFRATDQGSATVICSPRLKTTVLSKCFRDNTARIRLRDTDKKPRPRKSKAA